MNIHSFEHNFALNVVALTEDALAKQNQELQRLRKLEERLLGGVVIEDGSLLVMCSMCRDLFYRESIWECDVCHNDMCGECLQTRDSGSNCQVCNGRIPLECCGCEVCKNCFVK